MSTFGLLGKIKTIIDEGEDVKIMLVPSNLPCNGIIISAKGELAKMAKRELKKDSYCVLHCEVVPNEDKGHDFVLTKFAFIKE